MLAARARAIMAAYIGNKDTADGDGFASRLGYLVDAAATRATALLSTQNQEETMAARTRGEKDDSAMPLQDHGERAQAQLHGGDTALHRRHRRLRLQRQ